MHRGLEAVAIALIYIIAFPVAARYVASIRAQREYALISAARASAYFLLLSADSDAFINMTRTLPEAQLGLGEYTVIALIPERGDFAAVAVHFKP